MACRWNYCLFFFRKCKWYHECNHGQFERQRSAATKGEGFSLPHGFTVAPIFIVVVTQLPLEQRLPLSLVEMFRDPNVAKTLLDNPSVCERLLPLLPTEVQHCDLVRNAWTSCERFWTQLSSPEELRHTLTSPQFLQVCNILYIDWYFSFTDKPNVCTNGWPLRDMPAQSWPMTAGATAPG